MPRASLSMLVGSQISLRLQHPCLRIKGIPHEPKSGSWRHFRQSLPLCRQLDRSRTLKLQGLISRFASPLWNNSETPHDPLTKEQNSTKCNAAGDRSAISNGKLPSWDFELSMPPTAHKRRSF